MMNGKMMLGAVAGLAALLGASQAMAVPISSLAVVNQGQNCSSDGSPACIAVDAGRSNIAAIDAIGGAFFSLGTGGSISFDVSPGTFNSLATVIEVTNSTPNPQFPESAKFIFSGLLGTVEIEINNQDDTVDITGTGVTAVKDGAGGSQGGRWTFTIEQYGFDSLTILDTTLTKYASAYTNSRSDGFDIDYLNFSVPEPMTLSLLGMGLMGLGVAARRRRR